MLLLSNKYLPSPLPFLVILICYFGVFLQASGQECVYTQLSLDDGLPSSVVYQVLQDKNGFFWILTENGFCSYNGREINLYNLNNGAQADDNFKGAIYRNKLWLQSMGAFYYYDLEKQQFSDKIISVAPYDQRLRYPFTLDRAINTFFLRTDSFSISKIEIPQKVSGFNLEEPEFPTEGVSSWLNREEGLSTYFGKGLFLQAKPDAFNLVHVETGKTTRTSPYTDRHSFDKMRSTYDSLHNHHLLIFDKEIFTLSNHLVLKRLKHLSGYLHNKRVGIHLLCINQTLFICTTNGLIRITNYLSEDNYQVQTFFPSHVISDIMCDYNNHYWVSTLGDGIFFVPDFDIRQYSKEKDIFQRITGYKSEKIYASTRNKIYLFNHLAEPPNQKLLYSTSMSNIYFLLLEEEQDLWYGGTGFYKNGHLYSTDYVKDFFIDSNGNRLLAGAHKVDAFDSTQNAILRQRAMKVLRDEEGRIWIGNEMGLYSFSKQDTIFWGDYHPVLKESIVDMVISPDQTIWAAVKGKGILKIRQGLITYWDQTLLKNVDINNIYIDSNETLWFLTNKSINKLSLSNPYTEEYKVTSLPLLGSVANINFNDLYIHGNNIWLATSKGVILADKNYQSKANHPPTIKMLNMNDSLLLQAKQSTPYVFDYPKRISFNYSGISYKPFTKPKYQYRLLPIFTDWISTPGENVEFSTLSPGEYLFEVKAIDDLERASLSLAQVTFNISPPFYMTPKFYIGSGGVLLAFIWSLFRWQSVRIRKKEAEKHRLDLQFAEMKLKIIQSRMNPHFIFNAINTVQHFFGGKDPLAAGKYLATLSRLIRKFMDVSQTKLVSVAEEIQLLKLYCKIQHIRYRHKFDYHFKVDSNININHTFIPPMVLQIYVENAILHGLLPLEAKGELTIQFILKEDELHAIVEDNGIGRKQAILIKNKKQEQRKSWGMELSKERLELFKILNKKQVEIRIIDKFKKDKPSGTRVEIIAPLITE